MANIFAATFGTKKLIYVANVIGIFLFGKLPVGMRGDCRSK